MRIRDPGWKNSDPGWDPGWKKFGSGLNIPDPQHCSEHDTNKNCWLISSLSQSSCENNHYRAHLLPFCVAAVAAPNFLCLLQLWPDLEVWTLQCCGHEAPGKHVHAVVHQSWLRLDQLARRTKKEIIIKLKKKFNQKLMLKYSFKWKNLFFYLKMMGENRVYSIFSPKRKIENALTSCNVNAVEAGRKSKVHCLNSKIGEWLRKEN